MFVTLFRRSTIVINTNSKKQIIRGVTDCIRDI